MTERQLGATLIREPLVLLTPILEEPTAETISIENGSEENKRFRDRYLEGMFGALVKDRRQNYRPNDILVKQIAQYTTSLDINSPRKTGRALARVVATLKWNTDPLDSIDRFINTIKNQKPKNINLKGGV